MLVSKEQVLAAIDEEEEFEGEMPEILFLVASASKEAMTKAIRFACTKTKQNISRKVLGLSEPIQQDSAPVPLEWTVKSRNQKRHEITSKVESEIRSRDLSLVEFDDV